MQNHIIIEGDYETESLLLMNLLEQNGWSICSSYKGDIKNWPYFIADIELKKVHGSGGKQGNHISKEEFLQSIGLNEHTYSIF